MSLPIIDSPVRLLQTMKAPPPDRYAARLFDGACLWLSLFAMVRISYVVATTGADCITNDDILFVTLTENMFSGTYDWSHYFRDTFINGHCCAAIQALLLILGPMTSWNQYALCFVGIAMAAVRAHITARFLSSAASERLYWPILAIVSWMTFSYSQISIFTTGIFSVMWQSCLLLMVLGTYVLWQYSDKLWSAIASSALGIIACWNLALALPSWLVYFAIAILRGARRRAARLASIAAGTAIASTPYLFFLIPGSNCSRKFSDQFVNWFDYTLFVNSLGRTFANDIGSKFGSLPASELAGTVGLVLFALLASLMVGSARLRRLLAPCFILCLWSMILISMILVVRLGVAPWYALITAWFWSGLTAASTLILADLARYCATRRRAVPASIAPCLVLLTVAVWTWQYNKSYLDKQYYLENRTPVSASVMRNYDIAPQAFASYIFKLPLSVGVTATVLQRNQWSVFSRHQTWQMQGDAIFPLADGYRKGVDQTGCTWIRGTNATSVCDFRSPKHLNLCVPTDGVAVWRLSPPPRAHSIILRTAIALERAVRTQSVANWAVEVQPAAKETKPVRAAGIAMSDWRPISLDLSAYRGNSLTLSFRNLSAGGAVIFEFPVIEVQTD